MIDMFGMSARSRWGAVVVMVIGAGAARSASAQVGVESLPLAAAYGAGVHAYFSGDYDRTVADLGSIIAAGSVDPRAHYFRGLALLRMGRMEEAEADFADGADLETGNLGQWPVSRSLERVQGADRLQLERYRVRARVAKLQRDRDALQARMDDAARAQPDVLRERRPAPALPPGSVESNPFAGEDGDEPPPARPAVDEPAPEPAPEPVDEPVTTPESGPDEPASSTPFAEEPMDEEVPAESPADVPAAAEESTELEAEMPPDAGAPGADAGDAPAADPFDDGPAPDPTATPEEGAEPEMQAEPASGEAADADEAGADEADADEADTDEMDADEADTDEADADEADADEADADEMDADEADADEVDGQGTEPVIEGE